MEYRLLIYTVKDFYFPWYIDVAHVKDKLQSNLFQNSQTVMAVIILNMYGNSISLIKCE